MICCGCMPVHCGRVAPMEATEGNDRWAPATPAHTVRTPLHVTNHAVIQTEFNCDSNKYAYNENRPSFGNYFCSREYRMKTNMKLRRMERKRNSLRQYTLSSVYAALFKPGLHGIYPRLESSIPNKKQSSTQCGQIL
jgi:hypothetical protein